MLIGICAAILGLILHTAGARLSTREGGDGAIPPARGRQPVRPSWRVRLLHTAGWVASIAAVVAISDGFWDVGPGVSIAVTVAVLVIVNGLPDFIVALQRGRNAPQS
ncbi:hypothetical protein EF834_01460 [Rhodococcus spongiicola]|uniref:Uncharacterized protein n=1 Tax=Rhodococcus spongiicola TaxID=2487352 RepID=A0A3S3BPJ0_9NOCA|nr:hypothetical protein EF834_01460 [Rhodococcus spongiicola]